jgi:hypothetical protein
LTAIGHDNCLDILSAAHYTMTIIPPPPFPSLICNIFLEEWLTEQLSNLEKEEEIVLACLLE